MAGRPGEPKKDVNWEELWKKITAQKDSADQWRRRKRIPVVWIIVGVVVVIWLLTGIYTVGPGEVGVVKTFGKHAGTTSPGLNYHWPWPIQSVTNVDIEEIRSTEVGFKRTSDGETRDYLPESMMLTGDGNIAKIWLEIQYQVVEPESFVFNVRDPEEVIHSTTEVVLRGVIGQMDVDTVLTTGLNDIAINTKDELQILLDKYGAGIQIHLVNVIDTNPPDQVDAAYKDVSTAKQDKDRSIEEARGYAADLVPIAKGNKEKTLLEAEAYREKRVLEAQGDAIKFLAILREHEIPAAFETLADYGVMPAIEALNKVGEPEIEVALNAAQSDETVTVDLTTSGTPVTEGVIDQEEFTIQSEDIPLGDYSIQTSTSSSLSRSILFEIMTELGVVPTNQKPEELTGKVLKEAFLQLGSSQKYAGIEDKYNEALSQAIQLTTERLYLETMETALSDTKKYIIDSEASGNLMPLLPLDDLAKEGVVQPAPATETGGAVQ